ncbi:hypothetical protein CLOP_g10948 [Closterium sp. NIES-67]|nr:hypothetical protein CLOP_g10948 [Closterium sp. NIES-67]
MLIEPPAVTSDHATPDQASELLRSESVFSCPAASACLASVSATPDAEASDAAASVAEASDAGASDAEASAAEASAAEASDAGASDADASDAGASDAENLVADAASDPVVSVPTALSSSGGTKTAAIRLALRLLPSRIPRPNNKRTVVKRVGGTTLIPRPRCAAPQSEVRGVRSVETEAAIERPSRASRVVLAATSRRPWRP